jgi:hypothetical protein
MVAAVRISNLTNLNLLHRNISKAIAFESCVKCGWSGITGQMRLAQDLKKRTASYLCKATEPEFITGF